MMKAKINCVQTINIYHIDVKLYGNVYNVLITTDNKKEYIEAISVVDKHMHHVLRTEGNEGELRKKILDIVDEEWDDLKDNYKNV